MPILIVLKKRLITLNVVSKINCQVIDVSNKAIEETANIIVNAVQNQRMF